MGVKPILHANAQQTAAIEETDVTAPRLLMRHDPEALETDQVIRKLRPVERDPHAATSLLVGPC